MTVCIQVKETITTFGDHISSKFKCSLLLDILFYFTDVWKFFYLSLLHDLLIKSAAYEAKQAMITGSENLNQI